MPSGYPGTQQKRDCDICGEEYSYKPSIYERGQARFCSVVCANKNQSITRTGKKPYVMTEKTAAKLRTLRLGVPNPSKGIPRPNTRGEKSVHWKGGYGTARLQAMGKLEYQQWRTSVFERDDYICQICLARGTTLHADHIERWADNEEIRYNVDNGRTLCVPCHYYITFKRKMKPGQRWCNFTAETRG